MAIVKKYINKDLKSTSSYTSLCSSILRNMVVSGISITAKLLSSSEPEQRYGPFPCCFVYSCRGPFPSFLPHDFLFTIAFPPPLAPCGTLLFFHLLPSEPFAVMDALMTWLNGAAVSERCDFNSTFWQKLHCLPLNPELKLYFLDRNLTHMLVFTVVAFACTENLCNIFMPVAHRHTCLLNFMTVMNFGHLVAATLF